MLVKELREQLADMPGEMPVYAVGAEGLASAKHIFRGNLTGMEQFCEIRTYFQDHSENMEDMLIERRTGFKKRDELIEAYLVLKEAAEDTAKKGRGGAVIRVKTIRRLLRILRQRPYIDITELGQKTPKPKVTVGFVSKTGMASALTFDADDAGHAKATSYAQTYGHITGLPIYDRRAKPEIAVGST